MKTIAIISQHPEIQEWMKQHDAKVSARKKEHNESFTALYEILKTKGIVDPSSSYEDAALACDEEDDTVKILYRKDAEMGNAPGALEMLLKHAASLGKK